jgi:hypothetical protein
MVTRLTFLYPYVYCFCNSYKLVYVSFALMTYIKSLFGAVLMGTTHHWKSLIRGAMQSSDYKISAL